MRRLGLAAALIAAPAFAQAPPPSQPAPRTVYAVPLDKGPQRVEQFARNVPIGGETGWHTHPGVEIGFVVAGKTEMRLADGTAGLFKAGDSFIIPRGTVHNGVNVGGEPLRLLVTYVIDRDAPARNAAEPPHAP